MTELDALSAATERPAGDAVALPFWLEVAIAVVVLDLVIYLQHVMFHAVPALWRLHRMHHADLDVDVTTGSRFHPVEIVLSVLLKMAAVLVVGPPALAVVKRLLAGEAVEQAESGLSQREWRELMEQLGRA